MGKRPKEPPTAGSFFTSTAVATLSVPPHSPGNDGALVEGRWRQGAGAGLPPGPEHPFPAPVEDSVAAYRWLLHEGFDPAKIALGGDSAGGGLTVAALVQIRYIGLPMAAAGVCVSPWVDMEGLGESMETRAAADPMVAKENLMVSAKTYLAAQIQGRHWPRPCMPTCAGCLRC